MAKTCITDFAICSEGRCDLTGLPCLNALNLARQMARASASLGDALPETFGLEAEVEIADCLRPCSLSIAVTGARVNVSRDGGPLASAELPAMTMGRSRAAGDQAIAAIGWHTH